MSCRFSEIRLLGGWTLFTVLVCAQIATAVTTQVTHHKTGQDFLKGKAESVIVSSKGTLELSRAWEQLAGKFENVWSINSIITAGGKVFIGTSPNGGIYQYSLGKLTEVYSAKPISQQAETKNDPNDANQPSEPNTIGLEEHLANEHIFAMATDISGRLLASISGKRCALCRLQAGELQTIFEPNDAKYIFAIAVAENGNIYLGTGPEGKIYELDSAGQNPRVLYDSSDKNILSLATGDRSVYAGTDTRGLIYKIDLETQTVSVLYDTDQPEVTGLLLTEEGQLYAAATSAQVIQAQKHFARQLPLPGRPESEPQETNSTGAGKSLELKIANTSNESGPSEQKPEAPVRRPPKPTQVSHLYEISGEGFVTDVFAEAAVLFALAGQKDSLLLGTGNDAELYEIDPAQEKAAVIYKDEQASQITAIAVQEEETYLGTANPAKLIRLSKPFAREGVFTSDLVDASQPAKWGKIQIEGDIPDGCKVLVASRSGNVKDVNDPTFSDWTEAVEVTGAVQLRCPLGRYCQYKLILRSNDGRNSPLIREVAVSGTVPNLAPKVEEVAVERITKGEKAGLFAIKYHAQDDNGDSLVYEIHFRKIGTEPWIELADEVEQPTFEWDGRTVEDGRYEVRVTASDIKSNSPDTRLTGSRISEPVVVDNTGPIIEIHSINGADKTTLIEPVEIHSDRLRLRLSTIDSLSAIGQLHYTLDSNSDWKTTVPNDAVFDTTREDFTVVLEALKSGRHIVTIRAKDALENTTYKSIEINVVTQ